MKRITLIITLALAAFSFGSCISVDDLKPETPVYQPEEEPEEQPDEQPEDRPDEDQDDGYEQDKDKPLASSATDLASAGKTANCYIVSSAGTYKFKPVKGNSSTSVGSVSSVEVLWESFGTSVTPSVGDLIDAVNYDAGYVVFSTPSSFKKGNAVIAAKDASGEILWSWHIWLTDQPREQVYANNAGTMMDRNLGAISATPGDVGALGLLYQWGRKDPFLGSSSIGSEVEAKSTGTWPSAVVSSSSTGTIEYAVRNPMTFIAQNTYNRDWYYTSSHTKDNTRWQSNKSIYDPCPVGWRVPDGGNNGVWAVAGFDNQLFDNVDNGMLFINQSTPSTWYPLTVFRFSDGVEFKMLDGEIASGYWALGLPVASCFLFKKDGSVYSSIYGESNACGLPVRCLQE